MKSLKKAAILVSTLSIISLPLTSCDGGDDTSTVGLASGSINFISNLTESQLAIGGVFESVLPNGRGAFTFTFDGGGLGTLDYNTVQGTTTSLSNHTFLFNNNTSILVTSPTLTTNFVIIQELNTFFSASAPTEFDGFVTNNDTASLITLINAINNNNNDYIIAFDDVNNIYVVNAVTMFDTTVNLTRRAITFSGTSGTPVTTISGAPSIQSSTATVTYTAP